MANFRVTRQRAGRRRRAGLDGGRGANDAQGVVDAGDHLGRGVHGHARQPRRDDRDPGDPRGPAREPERASVDGQRLHADVRGAAVDRRGAGRPVRAPAAAGDRHRDLHGGVRRGRAGTIDPGARRRSGRPGCGRRDRHAVDADRPVCRRARRAGAGWRWASGAASAVWPSRSGRWSAARSSAGISWHWIFWLNVPIGLRARAAHPAAARRDARTRRPGSICSAWPWPAPASSGSCGVWSAPTRSAGPPRRSSARSSSAARCWCASSRGSCAPSIRCSRCASSRNRTFALANVASLFMFFGMFGSIFFISQFFQTVQGLSPFQSGLRILPWTAMPMLVAPIAGAVSDRIGGHRLMGAGLALAGDRSRLDRRGLDADDPVRRVHRRVRRSRASAWRCSSRPSPTSSCPPSGPKRKDRPPGPTTRSASSAACSASPCWRRCSPPTAATAPASSSSTA